MSWLGYRARILGLAAVLALLAWGRVGESRGATWEAGRNLFGGDSESPNDPSVSIPGPSPGLDAPDIAASRVGLVRQHEQAMEEMAQAFKQMAQGYASMRDPARFASHHPERGGRGFREA